MLPLLLVLLLLLCAPPVCAIINDENYLAATRHLKAGRWFERSARQLEKAAVAHPDNVEVHLALGCAYASRAVSLVYAATFTKRLSYQRAAYPRALADWEEYQKEAERNNWPARLGPSLPSKRVFATKDDDKPLRLPVPKALAEARRLGKAARAEWDAAALLAQTPDERARVEHTRGWGLKILRDNSKTNEWLDNNYGEPPPPNPGLPTEKEILAAFTRATDEAPDNAVYWQSLGDALSGEDDKNGKQAKSAYEKALALAPQNPALLYRLYELSAKLLPPEGGDSVAPVPALDEATDYLRRAVAADRGNSFFDYLSAALLFKSSRFGMIYGGLRNQQAQNLALLQTAPAAEQSAARAAVARIEQGNRKARYETPVYRPAVPPHLRAAWGYTSHYFLPFDEFARLRELARAGGGYALVAGQNKNLADGERAGRAVIGMGLKLLADWPLKDKTHGGGEFITAIVGRTTASIGHNARVQMYERSGDERGAARAQADRAAFKEREQAHRDAYRPINNRRIYEEY